MLAIATKKSAAKPFFIKKEKSVLESRRPGSDGEVKNRRPKDNPGCGDQMNVPAGPAEPPAILQGFVTEKPFIKN